MIDQTHSASTAERIVVTPAAAPLRGALVPPPDKSITHRALFFAALNNGITTILNPSRAADPRSTYDLLRTLGYGLRELPDRWELHGCGPLDPLGYLTLDCGNSGTTARLASGFLTGERGHFTLTGDESLARRPMERVAEPLRRLGASIETSDGAMPVTIHADGALPGVDEGWGISVASAQVHGALVLAALRSRHGVVLRRAKPMRDHTMVMARAFGARVETRRELSALTDYIDPGTFDIDIELAVPGDLSSAVFMVVAALIVPGSSIRIDGVGLNRTRTAFLDALVAMGASVTWSVSDDAFEPIGAIEASYSPELRAITLGDAKSEGPSIEEMIDELPLLALVAARADGVTTVRGAGELRLKESDRITATARLLRSLGVDITELEDGFTIEGRQRIIGGVEIDHHGDHRLCMLAAIAALVAERPVTIPAPAVASVSYPTFWNDLARITSQDYRARL